MGRLKESAINQEENSRPAASLGDLTRAGIDVFCWCNRCGHSAEAATEMLVQQLGPAFPIPEIGTRMRCGSCASKDVATRPAWPSRGQVTRHDQPTEPHGMTDPLGTANSSPMRRDNDRSRG
jgi:hypothetical protein